MCGVIGLWAEEPDGDELRAVVMRLFRESKIRGLHAFGFYAQWVEANGARSVRFKTHSLGELAGRLYGFKHTGWPEFFIGHNRYSTSGDWRDHKNNQPILAAGRALVFNGVIHMGLKAQMEEEFNVTLSSDNDGEVFLRTLEACATSRAGASIVEGAAEFVESITGSFAGCWIDARTNEICALRNDRRPLWAVVRPGYVAVVSTVDIVARAFGPSAAEAAFELPANRALTFREIRDERPQAEWSQQDSRLFGVPPSYGISGRYRSRLSAPAVSG